MSQLTQALIQFALENDVLRFGEFTLKSGRVSPYFFNAGLFNTGAALTLLGQCYAEKIAASGVEFSSCFGPAYKGVPLVAAATMALSEQLARPIPYTFNRKEAKMHGEGGSLIGASLQERVLIIDDVMTAGTAVNEAVDIIRGAGAHVAGVAIVFDRQEQVAGSSISATQAVSERLGCPVLSLFKLQDLIAYLAEKPASSVHLQAINAYQQRYGIT